MKRTITNSLIIVIIAALMVSCQSRSKDVQTASTASNDTVASKKIKPAPPTFKILLKVVLSI